ncbi:MAG: PA domain-containing protein [Saprospiraceae bacterium]
MKKFILLLLVAISSQAYAQKVVVKVNSPSSIAGEKIFGGAAFGADPSTGSWTGDLVLAEPNIGCVALTNAAAIAGKFCVIDRLTCSFDVKCLNAQDAGAIAVVIMNHNLANAGGPPFRMAKGNVGDMVTIPCIMLGYEDGLAIKAAMKVGTVNMTIGAFAKVANDLKITRTTCDGSFTQPQIRHPRYGSIPASQIISQGDMDFLPGGKITNDGLLNQNNCKLTCLIKNGNTEIYNKITDKVSIEVDSSREVLAPDVFDYKGLSVAQYSLDYTASDEIADGFTSDNGYSTYFNVSNTILSKSRFNAGARVPVNSGAYLFGGQSTYAELMVPFKLRHGVGLQIDSIYGVISTTSGSLADLYLEGRIYQWVDANGDNDITSDEMLLVALGSNQFDGTETRTSATVAIKLENLDGSDLIYQVKDNESLYFASIQYPGGSHVLFFGYDNDYNQKQYFQAKVADLSVEFEDYPYLQARTQDVSGGPDMTSAGLFYFDCNGDMTNEDETIYSPASIAISVSKGLVGTKDISNSAGIKIDLSPNPAKDILKASIKLNSKSEVNYQIFDLNGKLVYSASEKNNADQFNPTFNVTSLSNGHYILQVNTSKGFLKKTFVVVK